MRDSFPARPSQAALTTRLVLITACFCFRSFAQTEVGSLEWFQSQWTEAAAWELPPNTMLSLDSEIYFYVDRADLARLREEIAGRPEHPRRDDYARLKWQADLGSAVFNRTIWWGRSGWRLSETPPPETGESPHDVVFTETESWQFIGRSLAIADPRRAPDGLQHINFLPTIRTQVGRLAWASLGAGASTPVAFRPTEAFFDGDRWIGRVQSANGQRTKEFRGIRLDHEPWIRIVECRMVRSDDAPQFLGVTHRFDDWKYSNELGREAAHRVEELDGAGRLQWRMTAARIGTISDEEFDALTRVPSGDSPDLVRGPIAYYAVTDARPGIERVTVFTPEGERASKLPQRLPPSSGRWLTYGTWCAITLLVASLVWLKFRRT